MKSKFIWTGIVTGAAGTATALYMARKKIAAFAVKMASKAAVKAPITIANQAVQATVGKAKDTAKDAGKKVSGVTNKLPAQATVSKAKDTAKDAGKKVSGVTNKLPGKLKVGQ